MTGGPGVPVVMTTLTEVRAGRDPPPDVGPSFTSGTPGGEPEDTTTGTTAGVRSLNPRNRGSTGLLPRLWNC